MVSKATSRLSGRSNTRSSKTSLTREPLKIAFLPIKPIYAERLVSGEKFFEYRRRPISPDVTHIIVYASSPLKKIIGVVEVRQVHSGAPSATWVETLHGAGITEQEFHSYFAGRTIAYAIEIKPITPESFN